MINKIKNNLQNITKIGKNIPKNDNDDNDIEFKYFYELAEEKNIPELLELKSNELNYELQESIFLKHTDFRDEFVKRYLGSYKYYKNVEELEKAGFDLSFYLTLDYKKKEILAKKRMLYFRNREGKLFLGLYYPNIYIDFEFDEIFIFGNNIYNYFFGRGKDLTFLQSGTGITLEDLLQSMEQNNINDIGIDPINESQYIITAEISKKNVLLTERPILKDIIDDLFNSAMTKMGIDSTTEFPTITGLLKTDLVGQSGLHVKRTFRMNFIKVKMGYTASIRKFMNYDEIDKLGLKGLGYTKKAQELIQEAIDDKTGINMILGETNSGKSTLLASILNIIYKSQAKILSIENPIEIEMPYLQIDLSDTETADEKFKMTKEKAQTGILRHNPNVVLMSEIRTGEEIEFFAGLGLRGHMALATLHAGSVENALHILLKISDEEELKSILNLFVHQELIAKKCQKCNGIGMNNKNEKCQNCEGTGSKGVVPIYEMVKFKKLSKEDDIGNLSKLIENGKAIHISKKGLAEEYYRNGVIFEKDYKRIVKNNI